MHEAVAESLAERLDDLRRLPLAHHPVVHQHAGQLVADGAVHEGGRGGRVDAPGEAADNPRSSHLGANALHLLVDDRGGRPALAAADDITQEPLEDLRAVRGMDDLGVELDPVEPAIAALKRRDRRAGARGQRGEPLGGLEDGVTVAHPALLLGRQAREKLAAVAGERKMGATELPGVGALDAAAKRLDHGLHPVTDAEHRQTELEELGAQGGSAGRVHGRRAAGEDQRGGIAAANRLDRCVVREELGEDAQLAHPPRDELGVLAAEVEDQHLFAGRARSLDAPCGIADRLCARNPAGGRRTGRYGRPDARRHAAC